jgi:hypothetical protein
MAAYFTCALHLFISCNKCTQSMLSRPRSVRSILILYLNTYPGLYLTFSHHNPVSIFLLSHECYVPSSSSFVWSEQYKVRTGNLETAFNATSDFISSPLNIWRSTNCKMPHYAFPSILLLILPFWNSSILLSTLFSDTLNACHSAREQDEHSQRHKTKQNQAYTKSDLFDAPFFFCRCW